MFYKYRGLFFVKVLILRKGYLKFYPPPPCFAVNLAVNAAVGFAVNVAVD
jgi:hypothetical protein